MKLKRTLVSCVLIGGILFGSVLHAWDSRVIFSGATGEKKIALTFDDGPHKTKTPRILALLAEYGIRATFFAIGENAAQFPDIIREEAAAGHEIGNHTQHHTVLSSHCQKEIAAEIAEASETIAGITGKKPVLFRPPGGAINDTVINTAQGLCAHIVLWNIDTRDWAGTETSAIVANVKSNVKNDSIILFHDFTSDNAHAEEALRILIPWLLQQGYSFVTVSELLCR